jgi:hypothetical protein
VSKKSSRVSFLEVYINVIHFRQGIRPYKGVSINRPRVIEMTAKNYLWTICKDEKNNDELYYNAIWTREDKGQLTLYED